MAQQSRLGSTGGSPPLSWAPPVCEATGRSGRMFFFWELTTICQVSGSDGATCFLPPKGQPRHVHGAFAGSKRLSGNLQGPLKSKLGTGFCRPKQDTRPVQMQGLHLLMGEIAKSYCKGNEHREAGTDGTVIALSLPQSPRSWDQPLAQMGLF